MQRCSNKVEKEAARTRSGEEDLMKLCTTGSSEAGSIGCGLARCTTMVSAKEAAAAAGGVPEGEKNADGVVIATVEETLSRGWIPGQLLELPKDYVEWILSQKRHVLEEDPDEYYSRMINDPDRPEVFTQEFLEEERQLMRDIAEQYRTSGDQLEEFQEWVRIQLMLKGRVLVDETYLTQRLRFRQAFAEDMGALWSEEDNEKKQGDVAGGSY